MIACNHSIIMTIANKRKIIAHEYRRDRSPHENESKLHITYLIKMVKILYIVT